MSDQPINLLPIRAAVHVWQSAKDAGKPDASNLNLASYAAATIPVLCDEIVRLRALLADQQVTPA